MMLDFAGEFKIGFNVTPFDPNIVASVVHYGKLRYPLIHEARGTSLVYSQLYPFEGLQNYTSGIIHHVRLQGLTSLFNNFERHVLNQDLDPLHLMVRIYLWV